jgi:peptidyl-prolyl cis-trans isomerase B (cyclophilin B)
MKRKACAALAALCAAATLLGACGTKTTTTKPVSIAKLNLPTQPYQESTAQTPWKPGNKYPVATITLDDGGVIKAELYPDKAPNTVCNFISLAQSGYFAGRVFHRAVEGFMIQGGSPDGTGSSEGFPYSIPGEFSNNNFAQNNIRHTPGVLSMARVGGDNNSASCQFFIMHGESPNLDKDYAAFGIVTKGMDVVDRIANMPTSNETLLTPVTIRSVEVDTFGLNYPAPVAAPSVY